MIWFWYFTAYSFFGFLLEIIYSRVTGGHPQRKCLLVLPLCPVYGLGACAIVFAAKPLHSIPALLLCGGLIATAAEYLTAVFYEKVLGVSFWDYQDLPWNLHGRICLPFSLVWAGLTLPLVWYVHPALAPILSALPQPLGVCFLLTVCCDGLTSALLLRHHRHRDCLNWYQSTI